MVDWVLEILRNAPLVSAAAWFLLATLQVYRDRWHTWTETFFLFCCFFAAVYAIGDWLYFNARPVDTVVGTFAALVSLTGLTLAVNFFLLFTLVYVDRMRRAYWGFMAVTGAILPTIWFVMVKSVDPPNQPSFDQATFDIYIVYILVYTVLGIWNLYRLRQIVRESSKVLARRATGLMVTFTLVLVLGLGTNALMQFEKISNFPPPLSTLFLFVAASAYYTLFPVGRERISIAIRRFQARRYSIKAVFMTYEDGTLIGAKARPGESVIDQDLFGATLDVIQNFMRTSFPILRGKSLSSITHGSYTLVMERARYAYLTVVLEGEETDQLRRQMRDLLLAFEDTNRRALANWQGVPSDAVGTEQMLAEFFVEEPLIV